MLDKINRQVLLEAIDKIERNPELRKGRSSIEYDLVHENKKYPPILVLSEANKNIGGSELLLSDFGNSTKKAFQILTDNGFKIGKKEMGYFNQLKQFIQQSKTGELTTSQYQKTYANLAVKVSFGQGVQARIPWIAFIKNDQSVSNGIYPVYLYFKDKNILILAYGVSETNVPFANWEIENPVDINTYFKNNGLGKPERYGNSYIFKVYDLSRELSESQINSDLDELVRIYNSTIGDYLPSNPKGQSKKGFNYSSFYNDANTANLKIAKSLVVRFISSLLAKPFVILTGLSGSGKTKLAQAFTVWICENASQYCIVPVGADWTNREPLLGFPNALQPKEYVKPENGVLDLILNANENPDKPYFLILDEMNLSHVERYFADFLSIMESKSDLKLHSGDEDWSGIPPKTSLPDNLFVIGTVNIDETTYMFSPKVLDRANVIEFRVTEEEMQNYLQSNSSLDLDSLKGIGAGMGADFVQLARDKNLMAANRKNLNDELLKFFGELKKTGAEFGYRSAAEIMRFAAVVNKLEPDWEVTQITDAAVMQKLLPKVHGSRRKLDPVLKALGEMCLQDGSKIEDFLNPKSEIGFKDNSKIKYPISLEKILRMYANLINNGFTSYAEA